jgi:CAAX prenyl protease-like protein
LRVKALLPHTLPYLLYLAIGLAAKACPWADGVRAAAAGLALLWFARSRAYPELGTPQRGAHVLLGVVAGLAVGAAWVPLAKLVPPLDATARTGLDPYESVARTAFRIAGMVLVTPFAEELLVRSALPRFFEAKADEDWRTRPVGAFTAMSAAVSILFFTLTHGEWLAALATALLWTALLARTRNLRTVVIAHAVANAWLAGHVLVTGESQWW